MKKTDQTALKHLLNIVGVVAVSTTLVALGILHPAVFILTAIACYPSVIQLWRYITLMRHNTIRILRKTLPKAGFTIENTEWNEDHTGIQFEGKYQGQDFCIRASSDYQYILIFDKYWHIVKASDPNMPKIWEAINEVNHNSSNMSVIMCEPNDEGIRAIYTTCLTILPTYHTKNYLDTILCDMLNRRPALAEAFQKERPYMSQRRGPIGFNVQNTSTDSEEQVAPAAKSEPEIKD